MTEPTATRPLHRPPALPNPPRTNAALAAHWEALARFAGEARMPLRLATRAAHGVRAQEHGHGLYGAVLPTGTPGLVLKITRDADEARFVAWALTQPGWPQGIVRYYAAVALGGGYYALWREEVHAIGDFSRARDPEADATCELLHAFRALAWEARGALLGAGDARASLVGQAALWRERFVREMPVGSLRDERRALAAMRARVGRGGGPPTLGWALAGCETAAHVLSLRATAFEVGVTLAHYLDAGVLLPDVHTHNVGASHRVDGELVITDPGQATFLGADPPGPVALAEAGPGDWFEG